MTQHNRSQFEKYGKKNIFKHVEMLFYSVEKKKSEEGKSNWRKHQYYLCIIKFLVERSLPQVILPKNCRNHQGLYKKRNAKWWLSLRCNRSHIFFFCHNLCNLGKSWLKYFDFWDIGAGKLLPKNLMSKSFSETFSIKFNIYT